MLCLRPLSGNSRWKQVDRTHLIKGVIDVLPQLLIHLNPLIGFEAFGWERCRLRCTRAVYLHFDLVTRSLGRAASADRGLRNKTGAKVTSDWERESSEGLEDGGLPSACVANNYNLEI